MAKVTLLESAVLWDFRGNGTQHKFHYVKKWGRMMHAFVGRKWTSKTCTVSCAAIVKRIFIPNVLQTISGPILYLHSCVDEITSLPHFLNCITVFPLWPGMKSINRPPTAQPDKLPPLAVSLCGQMFPLFSLSPFHITVSGYLQKDAEGKDRTVFDIPIFTEEFLNHSKGKEPEHSQLSCWEILCSWCALMFWNLHLS